MEIVRRANRLRELVQRVHAADDTVGLVPTMGALHDGHLSLIGRAREMSGYVVMSLFVNPTQFGPTEDFASYPRDEQRDIELARQEGVDCVFLPDVKAMYPDGFSTYVTLPQLELRLCGQSRPQFFRGVATVVTKLLCLVTPDFAFFGEKDAQQVVVVKRLVRDLNLAVEIVPCPTVREADGLAMSSRNQYLIGAERTAATVLHRALLRVAAAHRAGEADAAKLVELARATIASEPLAILDYAAVVDRETLTDLDSVDGQGALVAVAVKVGKARLIDNLTIGGRDPESDRRAVDGS